MRARAAMALLLFCAVLLGGAPGTVFVRVAHACSCIDPAERLVELTAGSDAVFVGTLAEIRRPQFATSSMAESRFVFDVASVYKGDAVHVRQSIVTASDGASCGLELSVGETALVFGRSGGEEGLTPDGGEYASSLCEVVRGAGVASIAASLGPATAPRPGSSPIGTDDGTFSRIARNWLWIAIGGVAVVATGALVVRRRRS